MSDANTINTNKPGGNHGNPNNSLYKCSYSLSFAFSHLILWFLCGLIEFIDKFDKEKENHQPKAAQISRSSVSSSKQTAI